MERIFGFGAVVTVFLIINKVVNIVGLLRYSWIETGLISVIEGIKIAFVYIFLAIKYLFVDALPWLVGIVVVVIEFVFFCLAYLIVDILGPLVVFLATYLGLGLEHFFNFVIYLIELLASLV